MVSATSGLESVDWGTWQCFPCASTCSLPGLLFPVLRTNEDHCTHGNSVRDPLKSEQCTYSCFRKYIKLEEVIKFEKRIIFMGKKYCVRDEQFRLGREMVLHRPWLHQVYKDVMIQNCQTCEYSFGMGCYRENYCFTRELCLHFQWYPKFLLASTPMQLLFLGWSLRW